MPTGSDGEDIALGIWKLEKSGKLTYICDVEKAMRNDPVKSARLDTRLTPDLLAQVRRAAEVQGRSVSDYVAATLQAAVQKDIAETEVIRLSREASERLAALLIDPPPIAPGLARAFEHRRRLVQSE